MKTFICLLALSAMVYAEMKTNQIRDSEANNPRQDELSKQLDLVLTRLDQFAAPLAEMDSEERSETRRLVLKIVDFSRPLAERMSLVRQLLLEDNMSMEERNQWVTKMNSVLMLLDKMGQKAPVGLKMVVTAAVNLITSDKFVFASRGARKVMFLEEMQKIGRKFQETPVLFKEFQNVMKDGEIKVLAKKALGFQF